MIDGIFPKIEQGRNKKSSIFNQLLCLSVWGFIHCHCISHDHTIGKDFIFRLYNLENLNLIDAVGLPLTGAHPKFRVFVIFFGKNEVCLRNNFIYISLILFWKGRVWILGLRHFDLFLLVCQKWFFFLLFFSTSQEGLAHVRPVLLLHNLACVLPNRTPNLAQSST